MSDSHTVFLAGACKRCKVVTLTGWCEAMRWRVDVTPVPASEGLVLMKYGICLLVLDAKLTGLHASMWEPDRHDLAVHGRHLVAPHICASAHSRTTTRRTHG